jgi:hypothetical protein
VITLGACVAAVGASYSTEPVLPDGWAVLDRLDDGPVQAVLAEADGTRVLLLPGTNQWVDALRRSGRHGLLDVDARPVTYGSYRCHDGAVRYADRLERWEPASRGTVLEAHGCGSYLAQLGGLAAFDLTPWLEEPAR